MKKKIACKYAHTIETICTSTIDNDWSRAKVEVTRYVWDDVKMEWVTVQRVYKVHWYNIGMVMLRDWAGQQSFGAARGKIDIRTNAYIQNIVASAYYNIHRLKRRETKHQW